MLAMMEKTTGELVKEARERAGISQREAARKSGVTQAQWSRIEADISSPTVDTLRRIASALGVEASSLVE